MKTPGKSVDKSFLDATLRPNTWEHYIGQQKTKDNLQILLRAAKERGHAPEHILFHGPPGLGKTTLAHLIANEVGAQLRVTSGPAIEKVGDLASIITNLSDHDILFIDEIHRLNTAIEEILYPAMESGQLDIVIGKGPSARTIQLDLPPFTMVAATTQAAQVSSPLRSRFSGGVFRLDFYTPEEIKQILTRSADILDLEADEEALEEIAQRSRYTPRTANYFLKRCRDYAQVNGTALTKKSAQEALNLLAIDEKGLGDDDRRVLETIIDKFSGGPVGVKTLAAAIAEDPSTIEEVYEPYLMREGFLERTSRGRVATPRAHKHLGYDVPENKELGL
ncbi:MAG: Holliday junction branch migration DNA helicase RuvB [Candidatus Paceibacterota bacterium]